MLNVDVMSPGIGPRRIRFEIAGPTTRNYFRNLSFLVIA
jgi:hypothetical protein